MQEIKMQRTTERRRILKKETLHRYKHRHNWVTWKFKEKIAAEWTAGDGVCAYRVATPIAAGVFITYSKPGLRVSGKSDR